MFPNNKQWSSTPEEENINFGRTSGTNDIPVGQLENADEWKKLIDTIPESQTYDYDLINKLDVSLDKIQQIYQDIQSVEEILQHLYGCVEIED